MGEIEQIEREQREDDRQYIGPEYLGRRVPRNAVWPIDSRTDDPGEAWDLAHEEPGFAAVEDALSDEPEILEESQEDVIRALVDRMSPFAQDVYFLVFGEGYTTRAAAAELHASQSKVQRTVDAIKSAVLLALTKEDDTE